MAGNDSSGYFSYPVRVRRGTALFGTDPSPHFGRSVLVRAISYRIQEIAIGGLKQATQLSSAKIFDH